MATIFSAFPPPIDDETCDECNEEGGLTQYSSFDAMPVPATPQQYSDIEDTPHLGQIKNQCKWAYPMCWPPSATPPPQRDLNMFDTVTENETLHNYEPPASGAHLYKNCRFVDTRLFGSTPFHEPYHVIETTCTFEYTTFDPREPRLVVLDCTATATGQPDPEEAAVFLSQAALEKNRYNIYNIKYTPILRPDECCANDILPRVVHAARYICPTVHVRFHGQNDIYAACTTEQYDSLNLLTNYSLDTRAYQTKDAKTGKTVTQYSTS